MPIAYRLAEQFPKVYTTYRMKHVDENICKTKLTLKIMCAGEGFSREEAEEKGGSRRKEAEEERGSCVDQLFCRNLICPAEGVWVNTWMTHTFVESFS